MKRLPRNIFYLILILLSFSACQSVKEGFSGSKKSNSDEFLVEKKNPLVLPTDFDKLPEPKTLIVSDENKEEQIDLKTILKNSPNINFYSFFFVLYKKLLVEILLKQSQ